MPVPSSTPVIPRLRRLAGHLRPSPRGAVVLLIAHALGALLRLSLLGHLALTVGLEVLAALVGPHLRLGRIIAGRRAKASRTEGPTP
jgi:hypothetical protein